MAKYDAGYLSPIQNKLGNAVGRRWRGIPVLAVYNGHPANPRTVAQQLQREKLSVLSTLAKLMIKTVLQGYQVYCRGKIQFPRAMFVKQNYQAVSGTTAEDVAVDYSKIKVSDGACFGTTPTAPDFSTPLTITYQSEVSLIQSLPGYKAGDMIIKTVVYCPELGICILAPGAGISTSGNVSHSITVPASFNGLAVHVWEYVLATNDKFESLGMVRDSASPSVYVGSGTIG